MIENKYDFIKWMGQIGLNAVLEFILVCGNDLGWAITPHIQKIGTAFIILVNVFVIGWNAKWKGDQKKALESAEFEEYEE